MLAQLVVSGLAAGALYGLLALGLVMIYKTSDVLSFAQGSIAMVNTFVAFSLVETHHVPFWPAFLLTLAFAWCLGVALELVFLRPAKDPTLLGLIIITLGFDLILYGLAGWTWGYDTTSFPSPFSDFKAYSLGVVVVSEVNLWIFVVALGLTGLLFAFFRFTRLGVAMRAVAQNRAASRIMGVRIKRIDAMTWGIASVLGAVAGVLIAPITFLDINMGLNPGLKAFTAAVLGGMTSLPGAPATSVTDATRIVVRTHGDVREGEGQDALSVMGVLGGVRCAGAAGRARRGARRGRCDGHVGENRRVASTVGAGRRVRPDRADHRGVLQGGQRDRGHQRAQSRGGRP